MSPALYRGLRMPASFPHLSKICSVQVDAALDLSHTQNIGYVLKNHFAKSQFLVVSLFLLCE